MPRNVVLAANLPATPDRLFDIYLDSGEHSAMTGAPAEIEPRAGGSFRAFDGMLSGTVLHLEPKRLLVQTWRSGNWPSDSTDSVLTLTFWPCEAGGRIELVHANVPDVDFAGVSQGWHRYYWEPWQKFLADERVPARLEKQ